eukprot:837452-Pelagomonas_calceolata.AAC.1
MDLEGYWKHPVPEPGCEKHYYFLSCWLVSMRGARSQRVCLRLKVFCVVGLLPWLVLLCSLIRTTRVYPLP